MPALYSSFSGSSSDTSTAYSQPFFVRSPSSFLKWDSLVFLWVESSASFFISNMMEINSTPSAASLKIK